MPTAAISDEILMSGEGQIRALVCWGGNPAVAFPDQGKTERALASLELLVVIDPFLSATARLAHYVVAPKMPLETASVTTLLRALVILGC
jgi:anaerobic selenocysteine-containing dehydrogenase